MELGRVDFHLHQLGFEPGVELGQRRVARRRQAHCETIQYFVPGGCGAQNSAIRAARCSP